MKSKGISVKRVLIAALSIYITGCDSSPEKKDITKLTSDEITNICKIANKDIIDALKIKVKDELTRPYYVNSISRAKESNALSGFKYPNYDPLIAFSAKDFVEDFDNPGAINIVEQSGQGNAESDSLICQGDIVYSPGFFYGFEMKSPYKYTIKRKDGVLVNDTNEGKGIYFESKFNDDPFRRTTPKENQEKWISTYLSKLNEKIFEIKSIPKSEFTPISSDDVIYLFFANSGREFTDDEIISIFSNDWNSEKDTFVKDDIKKKELPGIKEKIKSYSGISNVSVSANGVKIPGSNDIPKGIDGNPQMNFNHSAYDRMIVDNPYSKELHGFKAMSAGCNKSENINPTIQGVTLDMKLDLRSCVLTVSDDDARNISAKFTSLQDANIESTANHYLYIDSYGPDNSINAIMVSSDFSLYKSNGLEASSEAIFTGEIN